MKQYTWAIVLIAILALGGIALGEKVEWITPLLGSKERVGLLYVLVNFAVLIVILDKIMFSKLRSRTVERHEQIKSELDRATTARGEAEALVSRFRERLAQLDAEAEKLKQSARDQAEVERKRIIESAQAEADRIRAVARATADREAKARIHEIEAEAVDRAVERAETILRERLSGDDQRRLVDDYVAQVATTSMDDHHGRRPA